MVGDKLTASAVCEKSTCALPNGTRLADVGTDACACTVGKTLAFTTITFRNAKGELAARGSHTKCVASPIAHILCTYIHRITPPC